MTKSKKTLIDLEFFRESGAKGGKKSRRKLTPEQARELGRRSAEARKRKKEAENADSKPDKK